MLNLKKAFQNLNNNTTHIITSAEVNSQTLIICGFPGIGKTYLTDINKFLNVTDLDFQPYKNTPSFPINYINDIESYLGTCDLIFVSSHKEVREELLNRNLNFILIYPYPHAKHEYINRYKRRNDDAAFIDKMNNNWDKYLESCYDQDGCIHLRLQPHQYLGSKEIINMLTRISKTTSNI